MDEKKIKHLLEQKNHFALGKLLREIENNTGAASIIMRHIYGEKSNQAHIIGVTGPPGAGKSTLIEKLAANWAGEGYETAILCIDPTSAFTGGALLGDRVRMQGLAENERIFIKSLASREAVGGMPVYTYEMIKLFEAFGKEVILVETVGAGQLEYRIPEVADTVALVTGPGSGDAIQTIKAGIMEVADLYVVNQADRPGSEETSRDIRAMVSETPSLDWVPPVIETVATISCGIEEVKEALKKHKSYLDSTGLLQEKRRERNRNFFMQLLFEKCLKEIKELVNHDQAIRQKLNMVEEEKCEPYTVLQEVMEAALRQQTSHQNSHDKNG